tara:strand:+ start:216 stop:638 length:423 start_codon:yes stop_codon:yes gene_type:complete
MRKFIIVLLLGFLLMPKEWLPGIWEALSFPIFGIPLWGLTILGLLFLLARNKMKTVGKKSTNQKVARKDLFMKCPYCREEIADGAKKCRYCNEFLDKATDTTFWGQTQYGLDRLGRIIVWVVCLGFAGLILWFVALTTET